MIDNNGLLDESTDGSLEKPGAEDTQAPDPPLKPPKFATESQLANDRRRKFGYVLGGVSFTVAVFTAIFIVVKMSMLLSSKHALTRAFLAAGQEPFRREILYYLGIIAISQSIVSIWLIIWSGKMMMVAADMLVPLNERRNKDDEIAKSIIGVLKRPDSLMDFLGKIKELLK